MKERGQPASFDPRTGEVHGSGSGAGGGGNADEDYDDDPAAGFEGEGAEGRRSGAQAREDSRRAHQDRGQSDVEPDG